MLLINLQGCIGRQVQATFLFRDFVLPIHFLLANFGVFDFGECPNLHLPTRIRGGGMNPTHMLHVLSARSDECFPLYQGSETSNSLAPIDRLDLSAGNGAIQHRGWLPGWVLRVCGNFTKELVEISF